MREIKFRAWDKVSKRIRKVVLIEFDEKYSSLEAFDGEVNKKEVADALMIEEKDIDFTLCVTRKLEDIELMQYTGFKDKNGVEIYEGDVLKGNFLNCYGDFIDVIGIVKFNSGCFVIETKNNDFFDTLALTKADTQMEVIGNIYENPELLEDKNG